METIKQMVIDDPTGALSKMKVAAKKKDTIESLRKEYVDRDRTIRATQVGRVQEDKLLEKKTVPAVRIPVNLQKKIVETSVAFEFGEAVTLLPGEDNNLTKLILQTWKSNRIDSKLQELKKLQKSETQAAMLFYMNQVEDGKRSMFGRMLKSLGVGASKNEIRSKILKNKDGDMCPVFDEYGDMTAFIWEFKITVGDKEQNHVWIFDKAERHLLSDAAGKMAYVESKPHGFDRIPVLYVSQDEPEWADAQAAIDRYEVALSKLSASNDYSGHPMLKIYGKVENAPDKDEDGKAWIIPVEFDDEGKEIKGDVQFLTNDTAPESVSMELKELKDMALFNTSTPNLSLNNLKDLGANSSLAIKLMFLEPMLKAKLNEGQNRTDVERIINIMAGGITKTTHTKTASLMEQTFFEIQFNSILPDDLSSHVNTMGKAVESGIASRETAVKTLGLTPDTQEELNRIAADRKQAEAPPATE